MPTFQRSGNMPVSGTNVFALAQKITPCTLRVIWDWDGAMEPGRAVDGWIIFQEDLDGYEHYFFIDPAVTLWESLVIGYSRGEGRILEFEVVENPLLTLGVQHQAEIREAIQEVIDGGEFAEMPYRLQEELISRELSEEP